MIHNALPQMTTAPVRMVDRLDGLSTIRDPGCAGVVWRRSTGPSFQAWLDALESDKLPTARMVLHPKAVRPVFLQLCDGIGTPECNERSALLDDVAALAECFAELMSVPWLRLQLEVTTADACSRSPMDAFGARLFCSYRGPASRWGIAADGAAQRCLFTLPTADPIVLRGAHLAGGAEVVHRSTDLDAMGDTRFVLTLDPVPVLEDAL